MNLSIIELSVFFVNFIIFSFNNCNSFVKGYNITQDAQINYTINDTSNVNIFITNNSNGTNSNLNQTNIARGFISDFKNIINYSALVILGVVFVFCMCPLAALICVLINGFCCCYASKTIQNSRDPYYRD